MITQYSYEFVDKTDWTTTQIGSSGSFGVHQDRLVIGRAEAKQKPFNAEEQRTQREGREEIEDWHVKSKAKSKP